VVSDGPPSSISRCRLTITGLITMPLRRLFPTPLDLAISSTLA